MDNTSYIALSRQMALQRQMAVVANNIANMTTSGFKSQKVVFAEALAAATEQDDLSFVQDLGIAQDFSPGPLKSTGNPFDVAAAGEGWFTVETPEGLRFTRNGHLLPNDIGEIVTADGHPLLDEGGAPIVLPANEHEITIAADGTVSTPAGIVARIRPVTFANEQSLKPVGNGLYESDEAPIPMEDVAVIQGKLESSNVQPVMEMTRMMETVRAFQNTQRLIETHHDLARRAVEQTLSNQG